MTIKNPPLKWHGGKHYLAKEIIKRFPPHTHYVEPFLGGGAVLLAKPAEWIEGYSEVVNDINGNLIRFWMCLQNEDLWEQFLDRITGTPFSQDFWKSCQIRDALEGMLQSHDDIGAAVAFFVRYRQSRQGLGKDFATLSRNRTRRGMNEQVSAWLSAVEGLPEAHERLKRVVILNDDAVKVIKQQDGQKTLFYCDPPYIHQSRSSTGEYGDQEMSDDQHLSLLHTLDKIQGKFILSGYHSPLYDSFSISSGWRCDEIQIDNKASGKKTKDIKTECLWMNFFTCEDCRKEIDQCEFDAFAGHCEQCAFKHC